MWCSLYETKAGGVKDAAVRGGGGGGAGTGQERVSSAVAPACTTCGLIRASDRRGKTDNGTC